jgi:arylsulfatase A-like enzyme
MGERYYNNQFFKMSKLNRPPNILFIMHDQQRYDCIGASRTNDTACSYPIHTPNLDKLAADGVFFENAYTTNPVCAPARQALFSGRRPEAHGGLWNPDICFPIGSIPADMPRWTKRFVERGYATSYIGQWIPDPTCTPFDYGFENYIPRSEIIRRTNELCQNDGIKPVYRRGFFGEPSQIPLEYSETHVRAGIVTEEIDRLSSEDKPWYIHIDAYEPHLPCRPSAPFDTMYDPDKLPVWGGFYDTFENKPYIQRQQLVNWRIENYTWDDWKQTVSCYYGIISQYDDSIGRIVSHLKKTGQYDNTVIIYTSDHGDMCGSHRMIDKHYIMYEDVCHVPLIIKFAGNSKPQRTRVYTQNTIDLPPTLLDIAGISDIPEREFFHGRSLAGIKDGRIDDSGQAVSAYNGQQFGLYCERSIKTDEYKYVLNSTDKDELYYLTEDPYELKNVIDDERHSDVLRELRMRLYKELERCGDPILKWCSAQLTEGRKL